MLMAKAERRRKSGVACQLGDQGPQDYKYKCIFGFGDRTGQRLIIFDIYDYNGRICKSLYLFIKNQGL
jgi:hypothetical protein